MLIRDALEKQAGGWYRAAIHLADSTFYCERHRDTHFDAWIIPGHVDAEDAGNTHRGEARVVTDGEEFEAQAVLDHYLQTNPER